MVALLLALVTAQGGKAQTVLAQVSARLGRRVSLLLIAAGSAPLIAAASAHAGALLHASLTAAARPQGAAVMLFAAGIILLVPLRPKPLFEPTRSLGAITLVLALRQSADAPLIAILGLGIFFGTPWHIAMGGALGGAIALAMGWAVAEPKITSSAMRTFRLMVGAAIALTAAIYGWGSTGL